MSGSYRRIEHMNDREEKFLIHIQIDGFRMPLNVLRSEEEIYRNAEKTLNDLKNRFQKNYSQRSYEEILKLVAFQLAVTNEKERHSQDLAPLAEKISELDREISQVLKTEK